MNNIVQKSNLGEIFRYKLPHLESCFAQQWQKINEYSRFRDKNFIDRQNFMEMIIKPRSL